MIIWINGAFGSGKTSVANELHRQIENSFIYDPEEIGQFIRKNVDDGDKYPDFQDHPLWSLLNYETLKHMASSSTKLIIVPMTLNSEKYYNDIVAKLREGLVEVKMYTLLLDKKTIHMRLKQRGDMDNSWAINQIDECDLLLRSKLFETHIYAEGRSVIELVEYIKLELFD